ncbi:MAG: nucleotidyltransferase domain-containing protein [Candidatus Atribacteria bacterium]|nr:nucleotidyltransferase domain-containing protein [Candidatus Atribacteria bacterium]
MEKSLKIQKEKIILKLKDYFKQKASGYRIEMAFLYGSWVRGYPHNDSDLDLALLFSSQIKTEESLFALITQISYELSKDLGREVNIIPVYKDFPHPMLYYNAIILGRPLYIKDKDKLLQLKLESIYQMEDFQIFGVTWQRKVAQDIIKEIIHA